MQQVTAYSDDARNLKRRLRAELRWLRLRLIAHFALMVLGGVGLLAAAALATGAGWMRWGPLGAVCVWIALAIPTIWLAGTELLLPLRRIANLKGFTREVEQHGHFDNLLEAATQFTSPRRVDPLVFGASTELVAEVLRRARREAESTPLARRIPMIGAPLHVALALVSLCVWLVLGVAAPDRMQHSLRALVHPRTLATIAPHAGLQPLTRELRVAVGSDVVLRARDLLGGDPAVVLQINRTGDFWQDMPTEMRPPQPGPVPYMDAVANVADVEDPFRYRFRKGDLITPTFEVSVRERPVLRTLSAEMTPPAYTGQPPSQRSDLGGVISVLEGTEVALAGTASVPLRSAQRLVEGQPPISLPVDGASFTDSLAVGSDISFRIGLEDTDGLAGDALTVYRFMAIPDDPPTVQITQPDQDRVLDRTLSVGVTGVAADDVGVARLDLLYRREAESSWTRRPLYRAGRTLAASPDIQQLEIEQAQREVSAGFLWNLGDERLLPGDVLVYCLEVTDNNALKGGQRARSNMLRLRLPTAAEVLQAQRTEQTEQAQSLESVLEQGQQLQQTLDRLSRELKKDPNPDWAKQQEIQEALKQQQELREQSQEAAKQLQKTLDDFERNNSGSLEMLQKMQTIQDLIDSLKDENLDSYLKAMREAMSQLSRQEVQRAMDEARLNQEDSNRRLDRTIELLRQLQRERSMSDLVEEVSEYLRRQQDLREQTQSPQQGHDQGRESQQQDSARERSLQQPDQQQNPAPGEESRQQQGENPSEQRESSSQDQQGDQQHEQQGAQKSPQDQQGQEGQQNANPQEQQPSDQQRLSPEELARAQEQLAKETAALEERLKQELEQLKQEQSQSQSGEQSPSSQQMQQSLQQALDQLQQQGKPSQAMQDATDQLQKGDQDQAGQQQEKASMRLTFLYQTLSSGMQGMQQANQKDAVDKLQKTAYDVLDVSFGQETVLRSLDVGVKGQRTQPVARDQARLLRSLERLSAQLQELARSNFAIPEPLLAAMRELVASVKQTVDELEMTRLRQAQDDATAAMGMMNRIVMNLLTVAQSSGGSGGGSSSQQMEQLAMDQSRLNGMTQELRQKMNDGLSEQERQQLAELRGRQEALRQQLDEIQHQVQDQRRMLGDLKEIGRQMEEVTDDLDAGRLSDETQHKQERILSRLLDAQRSVRERDFAKRRESQSATQLYAEQAGELLQSGEADRKEQVRRWLAPERAPHAYQEDVRHYFRKIQGALDAGGDKAP